MGPIAKKGLSKFFETSEPSKFIGFFSVLILLVVGIIASLNFPIFDMDKFVKFLGAFSWILGPFVLVVALGRSAKNLIAAKYTGALPQEERKAATPVPPSTPVPQQKEQGGK